jgi:hypothetical protein
VTQATGSNIYLFVSSYLSCVNPVPFQPIKFPRSMRGLVRERQVKLNGIVVSSRVRKHEGRPSITLFASFDMYAKEEEEE